MRSSLCPRIGYNTIRRCPEPSAVGAAMVLNIAARGARASDRLVIVVDQEKLVERLGEHTPVPVEVTQFGWQVTAVALAELS